MPEININQVNQKKAKGGARTGAGRKPGKVGKAKRELSEMAKEHAERALQTLVDIAQDLEAPHSARVSASNAILDRGYGKAPQSMELTGKDGGPVVFNTIYETKPAK